MTAMRRLGSTPLSFPAFRGLTRFLLLLNLGAFFLLKIVEILTHDRVSMLASSFSLIPPLCAHGYPWQPLTYSFVHPTISGTLFEMLSLWFLLGFLENFHPSSWLAGLYTISVLGTAATALIVYGVNQSYSGQFYTVALYGCFGALFGLLAIIGVVHGETEFLLFFIFIKARYMAIIYGLVALAMLLTEQKLYALSELGGAGTALLYLWLVPERGIGLWFTERWFGLINGYYRWKRRRAGRKFEVYMQKQGKTVHLDGLGKPIEDDPRDRSRWN
ncbi:rhomboid family intramembrane serine protease [Telmatobacter bradus]|uniref:rhomboid family intramembrane serine protease n=1 Tax=Telmatobacter bradus TaxID=474953 RepID=UPI003B42A7E8